MVLSQYDVEVCTYEDGESKRIWNVKLMLSEVRLEIFLKKYKKGP